MPAGSTPSPLLALLLVVGGACGSAAPPVTARGVLVIAVDALRADHLQLYGYDRDTMPNLAAFAREGVRFEDVFASAPQPIPAHASLLTGCAPNIARRFLAPEFEGTTERRWRLPERGPHLAVEFLAAGYTTALFSDHEVLAEPFGFDRGFQHYEVLDEASAEAWEDPETRVVEHFLQWLRGVPRGRPWFVYLHLNRVERSWTRPGPPEEHYAPRPERTEVPPIASTDSAFFAVPRSRWRGGMRSIGQYEAAYDGELRELDVELERLFANLRRIGRFDATSVHVLGTFGMQLGEAGLYLTAGRYTRADLGVPWVLRSPAVPEAMRGRALPGLVSLTDVAPTLLALEGLAVPGGMHGRSQAPALASGRAVPREHVFASSGLQEGCAVIGERYAFEYVFPLGPDNAGMRRSWTGEWNDPSLQPSPVFYDWRSEPYPPLDERRNLEPSEELAAFRGAALDWMRDMNIVRLYLQGAPLEESELARLRAKGYLATQ